MRFISLLAGLFLIGHCSLPAQSEAVSESPVVPDAQASLDLTHEESRWLSMNPTVTLGADPMWPPFSFYNEDGEAEGIDFEFLDKIGDRLGIKFEIIRYREWTETNQAIFRGELDVVSGISPTAERNEKLLFTQPYASFPTAIISRLDGPFATSLVHMRDIIVTSPRKYATTDRIKSQYPEVTILETENVLKSLELVSNGHAEYAFGNLATVSQLIRENGLTNLKIAGIGDMRFGQHFGIRKDLPLLYSSFQKALASINAKERAKILAEWVYIPREAPNPISRYSKQILTGVSLAVVAILGFWYWNRRLAREVAQRRKIEAELITLNEEKSRFLSMAAHDINNPLTAISMECQVALSRQRQHASAPSSSYELILSHAQRISHLIGNLISSDIAEPTTQRYSPQAVDLAEVVRKVVESFTHISMKKEIHIEQIDPPETTLVWADPYPLMQVLENLISNAVKFTPPAGEIVITSRVVGDRARVEIQDTGPGISEADRPHLFGWFSRLSAAPTGEEESHGLGLFIVKELMGEMKGEVWVECEPGKGANFIVDFQRVPADQTR